MVTGDDQRKDLHDKASYLCVFLSTKRRSVSRPADRRCRTVWPLSMVLYNRHASTVKTTITYCIGAMLRHLDESLKIAICFIHLLGRQISDRACIWLYLVCYWEQAVAFLSGRSLEQQRTRASKVMMMMTLSIARASSKYCNGHVDYERIKWW